MIGYGGLGNLITTGYQSNFRPQVLTASVLCVVLAVAFDLLLLGAQRIAHAVAEGAVNGDWLTGIPALVRRPRQLERPHGVPTLFVQHLGYSAAALGLACLVALPVGRVARAHRAGRRARAAGQQRRARRARAGPAGHPAAGPRVRAHLVDADPLLHALRDPPGADQRPHRPAGGRPRGRRRRAGDGDVGGRGAAAGRAAAGHPPDHERGAPRSRPGGRHGLDRGAVRLRRAGPHHHPRHGQRRDRPVGGAGGDHPHRGVRAGGGVRARRG